MSNIFTLPTFHDSDTTHKAQIVFKLLWGSIGIITATEIVTMIALPDLLLRWLVVLVVFDSVCLALLSLNGRGYTRAASLLFLSISIVIIVGIAWTAGGIKAPATIFLPVPVIAAGIILGWEAGAVTGAAASLCGLGLVIAEYAGVLPPASYTNHPINIWIAASGCISVLALLQFLSVESLNKALRGTEVELTYRRKAEEELRESHSRYRQLFEAESDAILVIENETGRIREANGAAAALYGYSHDELLSMTNSDLSVEPEETERVRRELFLGVNQLYAVPQRLHHKKDGTVFPVEITGRSFESAGRSVHLAAIRDITERSLAEDRLSASEEKYRTLFENMTNGFALYELVLDGSGHPADIRILDINEKAALRYSYGPEVKNKTIKELTSNFNPEEHRNTIQTALTGEPVSFERYDDASDTYVRVYMYSPKRNRTAVIWEDITPHKKAEKIRTESEERIAEMRLFTDNLVQSANTLIIGMDLSGKLTIFNRTAETITGYTIEELERGNWYDVLVPKQRYGAAAEEFVSMVTGGAPRERENPILTRSGEEKIIAWNNSEILSRGKKIGYLSFGIDVTARKQVEAELRASEEIFTMIFKASPDAMIFSRLDDGRIVTVNDAFTAISGHTREDAIGSTTLELHLWDDPIERESYIRALDGSGAGNNLEVRFRKKDGGIINGSLSAKIVTLRGVAHIISVIRDITELKHALSAAKSREIQLIQAEKMASIGLLVSGVAHEINNPNNYLLLNATILKRAWLEILPVLDEHHKTLRSLELAGLPYAEARVLMPDILQGMIDGTDRIKNIVDSLRTYSRTDTSDLKESVDLNKAVRSSLTLVASLMKKSTDRVTVHLAAQLPAVKGSQQQLEQVIINLLTNAGQALRSRSQGIEIRTFVDGDAVCCSVKDEGMGIDPMHLTKISTPFYTTKRDSGGTGLGLSVSNNIIQNHGGTIDFDSQLQRGTTVIVRLPAMG